MHPIFHIDLIATKPLSSTFTFKPFRTPLNLKTIFVPSTHLPFGHLRQIRHQPQQYRHKNTSTLLDPCIFRRITQGYATIATYSPYIFGICAYQRNLLVSWQQTDPGLKSRQMGASCCCLGLTIHLPGPLFLLDPVPPPILLIVEPLFWLKFRMRLLPTRGNKEFVCRTKKALMAQKLAARRFFFGNFLHFVMSTGLKISFA